MIFGSTGDDLQNIRVCGHKVRAPSTRVIGLRELTQMSKYVVGYHFSEQYDLF